MHGCLWQLTEPKPEYHLTSLRKERKSEYISKPKRAKEKIGVAKKC